MHIEKKEGKKGIYYRIYVSGGVDGTGKRIRKTETFVPPPGLSVKQGYQAALKYGMELEERCSKGAPIEFDKLKFADFCEDLYENHLSKLKLRTQVGYREVIKSRLIPFFGNMYLRKINPGTIRAWLDSLDRLPESPWSDKPLTDTSKADWFRVLSAVLGKAYEWEIIDENPCRRVPSPSKAKIKVSGWQLDDVLTALNKLDNYPNIRARMFLLLALNSGLREGELAGLEWQDFDFEGRFFEVRRTSHYIRGIGMVEDTPKSYHGYRKIPFNEELKKELLKYRAWQQGEIIKLGDKYLGKSGTAARVFMAKNGKPIFDSTIRKWLRDYCEWCGIPRITVHALRHTFASVLIADNVDPRTAADLLGHSSASLVLDVYANPMDTAKKKAIERLGNIYNQKNKNV